MLSEFFDLHSREVATRSHATVWCAIVCAFSLGSCAALLSVEAQIKGKVLLDGSRDHSGVRIATDTQSTFTDQSGFFSLKGKMIGDNSFSLEISKPGFISKTIWISLAIPENPKPTGPQVIHDVGTVHLSSS